jgi:hypothetical protein
MSMFGNLGRSLFGSGAMDPGLAHEFHASKEDLAAAAKARGDHVDVASILSALQGLGGGSPPPIPPPPEWLPMPAPSPAMADLRNAPRLAQRPLMPPPAWMQPYLWGER